MYKEHLLYNYGGCKLQVAGHGSRFTMAETTQNFTINATVTLGLTNNGYA